MGWTDVVSTPLQIDVRYAEPGSVTLRSHPVVGSGQLTALGSELNILAGGGLVQLVPALDSLFDGFWTQSSIQTYIQAQIQSNLQGPNVSNISLSVPQRGTLQALVTPYESTYSTLLPSYIPASLLNLSYRLSGFSGNFKVYGFAQYNYSFDGSVDIYVAIPHDPRQIPGAVGYFNVSNASVSQGNFGAWVVQAFVDVLTGVLGASPIGQWTHVNAGSLTGAQTQADGSQDVTGSLQTLFSLLQNLWPAFAQAEPYGFSMLVPEVVGGLPGAPAGSTVTLALIHPVADPPVISLIGALTGSSFLAAQVGASPAQGHPGDLISVTGIDFPGPRATTLSIEWSDTSLTVSESVVLWGVMTNIAAGTAPLAGTAPPAIATTTISRAGRYDGKNQFTPPLLLQPDSWYGFQVQDFDLVLNNDVVSTQPSKWTYFQTSASDQIELALDGGLLPGAAPTLRSDGTFTASMTVPDISPGVHVLTAALDGQARAHTNVTVIGAGDPVPPTLQIIDPATGWPFPGSVSLITPAVLRVLGTYFAPGAVALYLDLPTVAVKGSPSTAIATATATSNPPGTPATFTVDVPIPAVVGNHVVTAKQGSSEPTAPFYGQRPAQ
jgi:hypothetical protein